MKNPDYRPTGKAEPAPGDWEIDLSEWLGTMRGFGLGFRHVVLDPMDYGPADSIIFFDSNREARGAVVYYETPPLIFAGRPGMLYLYVAPEWRDKGIGRELLAQALLRWDIRVENQPFTADGAHVTNRFIDEKLRELGEL